MAYGWNAVNATTELCPPIPNEFEIAGNRESHELDYKIGSLGFKEGRWNYVRHGQSPMLSHLTNIHFVLLLYVWDGV